MFLKLKTDIVILKIDIIVLVIYSITIIKFFLSNIYKKEIFFQETIFMLINTNMKIILSILYYLF